MRTSIRNFFRLIAEDRNETTSAKLATPFLELSSWIYSLVVGITRSLYEKKILPRKKLPFPVVSVGNLTWGGTGKTPLVEYLARRVSERRRTPLILTRGYGQDEVKQLEQHLPRVVIGAGKDRASVAEKAKKNKRIHMAILDDGFQHWPIERDIEIVSINALNPFGNGRLIPRGSLREPIKVLNRASIIVITHVNLISEEELKELKEKVKGFAPKAFIVEAFLEPLFFYRAEKRSRVFIQKLKNRRVTTLSGVGSPQSFQRLLTSCQIKPARNFEFIDHHSFSDKELQEVKRVSESASVDEIITTEKDFYRSPSQMAKILNPLILATRLRIQSGEEVLTDRLFRLLGVTH